MNVSRQMASVVALTLVLAACGGSAATTDTTGAAVSTTASSTTAPSGSSSTAVVTMAVPTTTAAPTTTLAADAHPVFGIGWEDSWPDETKTAVYRVDTFSGVELELPARMEYGVEFAGGTYDRLVVGTPEPGNDAMVIYFDRSEPWEIRVVGEEVYSEFVVDGPASVLSFEAPLVFSGLTPLGDTETTEGLITLTFGPNDVRVLGATYQVTPRSIGTVTVPAGEFSDALIIDVLVGGELIGGTATWGVEIWLHTDQFILNFFGSSGFDEMELLEPWG